MSSFLSRSDVSSGPLPAPAVLRPFTEELLRTVVVVCCLAFPLVVFVFAASSFDASSVYWVQDGFYHVLVGATVGLAFIAFYFAYKEFLLSRNLGIHLMSLAFLLFSLLQFGQSLLGPDVDPILVASFGTHARLLFALFLMVGVLASTQGDRFGRLRRIPADALNWVTAGMIGVAAVYIILLRRGLVRARDIGPDLLRDLNVALDIVSVACLATAVLSLYAIYRHRRNPMALVLAMGAGFAIEATWFFSLSQTWDLTWWTAHGVVAMGLVVLTYGIVLITHTRESDQLLFDLQFSRQELERIRLEQQSMQRNLERLQFVVTVSDSLRHEILNPHAVIRGNAEILLNSSLEPGHRPLVAAISRQSNKVVELLDRYTSLRETVEVQKFKDGETEIIDLAKSR